MGTNTLGLYVWCTWICSVNIKDRTSTAEKTWLQNIRMASAHVDARGKTLWQEMCVKDWGVCITQAAGGRQLAAV